MKNYLIANWKENKTLKEVQDFFEKFAKIYKPVEGLEVVICPSFPYLAEVKAQIEKYGLKNVNCGAQDASVYKEGSHTGEVSPLQIKDYCDYVILGHSERAESFNLILEKISGCHSAGLTPIICLSAPEEFMYDFIQENVLLVWEDPSNISKDGVFRVKSESEFEVGVKKIKDEMPTDRPLIYGGSVNQDSADMMLKNESIKGFLVGKASLTPETFNNLAQKFN